MEPHAGFHAQQGVGLRILSPPLPFLSTHTYAPLPNKILKKKKKQAFTRNLSKLPIMMVFLKSLVEISLTLSRYIEDAHTI